MPAAIGIDLGTTFSAVAYVDRGETVVIQNNAGHDITPSVVHFDSSIVLVGEEAVKKRKDGEMNTIFNVKRLMGRKHDDVLIQQRKWPFEILRGGSDRVSVRVDAEIYTPEQISAFILNYIKRIAKKALCEEPVDAVITVPANFTNAQREATRDAGRMAGFNVLQIVNEPTAAAIAFCEQMSGEEDYNEEEFKRVLVFDLGGGTFDVSIVEIQGKRTKVLATDGLTSLGGVDFDERIYEEALARFQEMGIKITGVDWTLMEQCEAAKRALSKRNSARISHPHYGGAGFDLTYSTFVELCEDLLEQTLTLTEKVMSDAGIGEDLLDEIMLVGGSTRIRRVHEMLEERFADTPIRDDIEPELAVAKGAAILADSLSRVAPSSLSSSSSIDNYPVVSLIDVTPLPLGMTLDGDRCKVLIPKNTVCPFTAYQYVTNVFDGEEKLMIEILEGDSATASSNNTLAKVEICVTPKPRGKNYIKVLLSIDVNGILDVHAIDEHSKEEVTVTIRSDKLDDFEIVKMTQELSMINQGG